MDTKFLIFLFGIPIALMGVAYKDPKAYHAIISPVIHKLFWIVLLVVAGAVIGHFLAWQTLRQFLEPAKLAEAKKALDDSLSIVQLVGFSALFLLVMDVGLDGLARKSAALKAADK